MALKQYSDPFVICPKQGNEIEGIVLNRVCILGTFCPKQGQGFSNCQWLTCTQILVAYPRRGFVGHFYPGVGGNEGGFISKSCAWRGKWDLVKKKVKNMKTIV